jgi:hypothetical protein
MVGHAITHVPFEQHPPLQPTRPPHDDVHLPKLQAVFIGQSFEVRQAHCPVMPHTWPCVEFMQSPPALQPHDPLRH